MKAIKFLTSLPWTDKTLYNWFCSAVKGVRFRYKIDNNYCCWPDGFINIKGDELENYRYRYWITPQQGTGMWGLIGVLLHEAHHAEGYPHTAPNGINDQSINEMGAWGIQY